MLPQVKNKWFFMEALSPLTAGLIVCALGWFTFASTFLFNVRCMKKKTVRNGISNKQLFLFFGGGILLVRLTSRILVLATGKIVNSWRMFRQISWQHTQYKVGQESPYSVIKVAVCLILSHCCDQYLTAAAFKYGSD